MNIHELKTLLTKWENEITFNANAKVQIYLENDVRSGYYDITGISIIDEMEIGIDADFKYINLPNKN